MIAKFYAHFEKKSISNISLWMLFLNTTLTVTPFGEEFACHMDASYMSLWPWKLFVKNTLFT